MSTVATPTIPPALDDAWFNALRGIIGTDLAFAAVDACWLAFCEAALLVTRLDAGGLREILELEVAS